MRNTIFIACALIALGTQSAATTLRGSTNVIAAGEARPQYDLVEKKLKKCVEKDPNFLTTKMFLSKVQCMKACDRRKDCIGVLVSCSSCSLMGKATKCTKGKGRGKAFIYMKNAPATTPPTKTDPPTQLPTKTDPPTQPPTKTDPPTTDSPTVPPTEPPTEPQTEPPKVGFYLGPTDSAKGSGVNPCAPNLMVTQAECQEYANKHSPYKGSRLDHSRVTRVAFEVAIGSTSKTKMAGLNQ